MNILIMGGPGAGKGTMSARIVDQFQVNHISTGDIFRSEISGGTDLGLKAKAYMDQGLLVPDTITNRMVKHYLEQLKDPKNGFLLDGYPRTIDQAKAFDELSKGTDLEIDIVIAMEIPFDVLAGRITGRRLCKECGEIYHIASHPSLREGTCDKCGGSLYQRKDDTIESLQTRLKEYTNQTEPVLKFYKEKGIVTYINANQSMDDVWQDVKKALEKK